MANAEVDTEELVEKYRRVLAKIDGVTQTVLSGHFEIETHLDDVLALVFPRHHSPACGFRSCKRPRWCVPQCSTKRTEWAGH
jgi:hypothetical protein